MGEITKIEQQKNKDRVNIFVDDSFFCGLGKETAVVFGLKVGKTISEEKLLEAIKDSETKRAFDKGADYLASRMHSKKELTDKLIKKGFDREVSENAVKKLEEYGYVDDKIFAKMFVEQNPKYSKLILENKLKQKGVTREIIQNALQFVSDETESEMCLKYAKKYASSNEISTREGRQKMFASLARRGYSFDLIKKTCEKLLKKDDIFEDF